MPGNDASSFFHMCEYEMNLADPLTPEIRESIVDTALFYPCCGQDLDTPIRLFAPVLSDFYFVDVRRPRRPAVRSLVGLKSSARRPGEMDVDGFVHLASGHNLRLHRCQRRAEKVLHDLPKLGVFFFRGDNPVDGEGSSGVLWLGGDLFYRVLTLLVPGGLVVTDGSNPGPNGPTYLSDFYHNRKVGPTAISLAVPFEYGGRTFTCIGYAGEKNGPTLIWQAA